MSNNLQNIKQTFKGRFLTEPEVLLAKLLKIKAYVFDWDGVFNNGAKDEKGSSPFNEVDSMGLNMLRFNHYLRNGHSPIAAVISGEKNKAAFSLSEREHFNALYYGMKNKKEALSHLSSRFGAEPDEVVYVFDDVLDLSIAPTCGIRIMVGRDCNPLLIDYAVRNNMVDYITYADGGHNAVREAAELLIGLTGKFDETITHRINYTGEYKHYLQLRNSVEPLFFTSVDSIITERPFQ